MNTMDTAEDSRPRATLARAVRRGGIAAAVACALAPVQTSAAQTGTFPVIVVMRDSVPLAAYAGQYRPDARAAADPDAWGYLRRDVAGAVQAMERGYQFRAEHVYSHALRGFSARLTARQIVELEASPLVDRVEADGVMEASKPPTGGAGPGGSGPAQLQVLPWGVDYVEADGSSTRAGDGAGTLADRQVYVIDTGIDASHPDLSVVRSVNFAGGKNNDCNGHGTHVAGTVAALDNDRDVVGVAPGASLYAVKVLGCSGSGTTSGVIKGIDWVTANAAAGAVANMSLGGGASQALDDAVTRSVAKGTFYALAAGNETTSACDRSPARVGAQVAGALTVGATNSNGTAASFSNYGPCVEIWAPGVSILSTRLGGGTTTLSGTSMASPHVAGGAALFSLTPQSPDEVENALTGAARGAGSAVTVNGSTAYILNVGSF